MTTEPIEQKSYGKSLFDFKPVQEAYPFYFKIYDFKKIGWVFLLTMTIIPFVILLILRSTMRTEDALSTIGFAMSGINFACLLVAFIVFSIYDWKLFKISGFIWFFIVLFSYDVFGILLNILAIPLLKNNTGQILLFTIGQMLFEILFIVLFLVYSPSTRKRIGLTFKLNWLAVILIALATATLMWVFSALIWPLISHHIPGLNGQSENQKNLDQGTTNIGILILNVMFTVLIAPLYEELVYRNFFSMGFGSKIAALFGSAITFALIHVSAGDIEHIVPYLIGGFFLSGIFTLMKGNVTYSWMAHLIYNSIGATISIVVALS